MKRILITVALLGACASAPRAVAQSPLPSPAGAGTPEPAPRLGVPSDTLNDPAWIPAGYGTLRQDDLAVRLQFLGITVRAIPLDENVIRALSPDSYRALRELRDSKFDEVDAIRRRTGLPSFDLWYITFFNVEQGEARFSPFEVILRSQGRDFRPIEVLALSPGFGEQRLRQRETANAIYLFDPAVEPNQPIGLTVETQSSDAWSAQLRRLERERQLVRSRAKR